MAAPAPAPTEAPILAALATPSPPSLMVVADGHGFSADTASTVADLMAGLVMAHVLRGGWVGEAGVLPVRLASWLPELLVHEWVS